jgi:hypothetical protein
MSENFLEILAHRLIEGRTDSDRDQLLQQARAWIHGCNPLHGADLIEQRPLPDQLQAELNAYAISLRASAIGNVPDNMCSEALCLAAVRQDGLAIESLPKIRLTPEICLEAVKQNARAIEYVPFSMMTDEILRTAGAEHV